ncbi:3'-5' exonuclease [Dictyobacter arantiisoli]|uniref:Exonuclease domain-containing protein n=1 Tax=Dictyobacter arantiisoli TaxID=2014874 RepID=A0A5A5T7F3_9CHLR|nr:hypothetical protein [Dictyobacter arantiisoli]GCF07337.1 hypothetical protein KDI_09010 [Dictyobacter arantiisoli]
MDLNKAVAEVDSMLDREISYRGAGGVEELLASLKARARLDTCIGSIEETTYSLRRKQRRLSDLPPLDVVRWAQTVLCMPNLVFLELDTTGLYQEAKIIRVTVLDGVGACLLDLFARTSNPIPQNIERITGITNQDLQSKGQDIISVLGQLQEVLTGKYVLSYNLDFDTEKLQEAAARLEIEPTHFIGEDLMLQATRYFVTQRYPRLETVCQQIGKPLPAQPGQISIDRAKGQIALIHAIANAVTTAQPATTPPVDIDNNDDDLDEHPF